MGQTKTKDKDVVASIDYGSRTVITSYLSNPSRTVWDATSTTSWQLVVKHRDGTEQGFTGNNAKVTLQDGIYEFRMS